MNTPRFVRIVLGLGLLAGGVALAEPKEPHISVRLPKTSFNVRLTGKDIVAPHFQLSHSKGEMKGRFGEAVTVISLKDGEIKGNLGGGVVNLKTKVKGDTVEAEGGFGGSPAEVKYSPKEITVYVSSCTWRLKNTEEGNYVGKRSCDRVFEPESEVVLPSVFWELTPAEQVVLLLFTMA
jgi:hypothetical protein